MKKNKKIEPIEIDALSCDLTEPNHLNQSITDNNTNKDKISIDSIDKKAAIRKTKTKTTRPNSMKKPRVNKRPKSPNKNKKNQNKNNKKVKFIDKVDIIKVECWKQYNLEQTADEVEYVEDYLDESEGDNKDKKSTTNTNTDNKNIKKNKRENKDNNKGKGKKKNYTCVCNII